MKKILCACLLVLLACNVLSAENYDISGRWYIHGTGFAEKSFVRSSLELEGYMNLTTQKLRDISRDIQELIINDETIALKDLSDELLNSDMRALTGYEIYLDLDATTLGINAWNEYLPNGIKIPVLLPEIRPSNNNPFTLPAVTYEKINYQVTFTSTTSGTVRMRGYIDVDVVGECELNADSSIWKEGSQEPARASETSSGCNFGFGIFTFALLLLFSGVLKFVRH